MRKITLLLGGIIISFLGHTQIVFDVQNTSCNNLIGTHDFTMADTDGSATDWGQTTDMFVAANAITAELVLVDDDANYQTDGSSIYDEDGEIDSGGNSPHNTNEDACDSVYWTQDLTGKIAVAYRGKCEFGLKALNAEKRGAVALVLINHSGDPIGMAGGQHGAQSTIPVIMLSETKGNEFAACLSNGGNITAFLGSKIGLHPNDMASSKADILMAENSSQPFLLAMSSNDYTVDFGIWAYNLGTNDQNNVVLSVNVEHQGNSVYTNSSMPLTFLAPDTSHIDTQYVDLGSLGMDPWPVGTYTVTYNIDNGVDDAPSDNQFIAEFKISAGNNFAKSRTDAQENPIHTTAFSLNEGGTPYDDWESCIQFKHSNASALFVTPKDISMTFSCQPVGSTMSNEIIEIRAYSWDDTFTDLNDPNFPTAGGPGPWTLTQQSQALHFYLDESENGVNINLPFDDDFVLSNDQRYLFCVYNASDSLRIGYDAGIDYTATVNNYLEACSPVKTLANGGSDEWYAAGFGYDVTSSITVHFDNKVSVSENVLDENSQVPYPNPAKNLLTIPVRSQLVSGNVLIEVLDLTGKAVLSESQLLGPEKLQLNVAAIPNGAYFFRLTFDDGSSDAFKVSVNR